MKSSYRNLYLLPIFLAPLFLLSACSTVVPVHEAEPPEVLQLGDFRLSTFGGKSPVIAPKTSTVTNQAVTFASEGYRIGFGILERLQANVEIMGSGFSVGLSGSVKYQWRGDSYFTAKEGNKSQSTILRSFTSSGLDVELDSGYNIYPYADLTARGADLSHVFGYRIKDWFGVYGGPKFLWGKVRAEYKNSSDGPVVESRQRHFEAYGLVAGTFLSFTGKHIGFDITLEYDGFEMPASYGPESVWYNSYMFALAIPFGF